MKFMATAIKKNRAAPNIPTLKNEPIKYPIPIRRKVNKLNKSNVLILENI